MNKTSMRILAIGLPAAVIAATGIAVAAWTSTGAGSGTATGGSDAGLTVSTDGAVAGLTPTGTKTFTVTVTNNNPYKVALTALTAGTVTVQEADGAATTFSGAAACAAGVVTKTADSLDTSGEDANNVLAASGVSGATRAYDVTVTMDNAATDRCQGASFTVPVLAAGSSTS